MRLEIWAARLGYVVDRQESLFFVQKENGSFVSFSSKEQVVDFILEKLRRECCEDA